MAGALPPFHVSNQPPAVSISSSPSLPDSGVSPVRPFAGADKAALYDRKLLEELVDEISSVRKMTTTGGVGDPPSMETKKRKRELETMLTWLRSVALNPVDPALVHREKEQQILNARREMFVKIDDVADLEELPDFASLRKKKKAWHYSDERYKNKRRSERIAKCFTFSLSSHLTSLRKRIGIGDIFQAEIPAWSGPPSDATLTAYKSDPTSSKYLGTPTWPTNTKSPSRNSRSKKQVADKCNCVVHGSVDCVRVHVDLARTQLRSELGPAFYSWGFDSMGDYLSTAFLTRQEQLQFEPLEKMEGLGFSKGFWSKAGKCLEVKKRRDLVWYYFNVHLLRRVGLQSRTRPVTDIDSSDEEVMDEDGEGNEGNSVISQPGCVVSSSSSSSQQRPEKPKRKR